MYQALYRKYRPATFEDVCGQEHITSVLKTQLQKGRTSHAYIFCGSRGTGKTTCAKILAKAVNCENLQNGEPCNACPSCLGINEERVLDVVEMDAASNNGVDHIRRICDEVQFLPSESKKRVYIIDEVHMLSTSAFNALLKTIEEPPSHVLFILATTEMNDIPATIMSRCQRFDFKRITSKVVSDRLMLVAQKEGIALSRDGADVIARLSDGAMRDALSLLEACQSHQGNIDAEVVHTLLGIGNRDSIIGLCRAIAHQNASKCLDLIADIYDRMSDFKETVGELIAIYRDLLVMKTVPDYKKYVESYENEISALEEIASSLTVETIMYQSATLEAFYVSYDQIATGKKAAAEILMIRLCKEELSTEPAAILSRISKIEKALRSGAVTSTVRDDGEVSEIESKPQAVCDTPAQAESIQNEGSDFAGSVRLKNALQQEPFLKPWLSQIDFEKRGTVLHVLTGSFVKGMLLSAKADELIEKAAKEIDPLILSISFDEKDQNTSSSASADLEDL